MINIRKGESGMTNKVLFFDIDGTLVDSSRGIQEITDGVKQQLRRLKEAGHKLFICSGRPKVMLDQQWLESDDFDGFILANGGYVEINRQSIYEELMDYQLCVQTVNMLEKMNCDYMIETAQHVYIKPESQELYTFFKEVGFADKFIQDFDRDEVLHRTIKIEANVLNEDRKKIEEYVQNDFGYVINFDQHGTENAFEFYSPTLSKAIGIQKVLDYYHMIQKDTYAFGDGMNDIEMIKFCEVGVAMGNACDELKDCANLICDTIENQGLKKILKQLFPQE